MAASVPTTHTPRLLHLLLIAALPLGLLNSTCPAADYENDIKPLLKSRCYACHGALKQEAGLRLDTGSLIRSGGDSGPALQPGQPAASLLVHKITATDPAIRMPPEGEPLSPAQISLLQNWIADGGLSPDNEQPESDPRSHWAFQPITRPPVPAISSSAPLQTIRNPIDAFLQQRRLQADISPQPEAPRIVLLRRLHMDLLGLPPTLADIAACENDPSPDWYERTVTRLLQDPRHGERWARHWMDVWRYSDWWGLGDQLRNSQKHIWHWRDWIVESLNADTPYDEMVRLMLAGDELHPNDLSKLRATGYLARNYWLFNRPQWMEETVEHVSKGFLGLTMNCARCHDHKYDPLQQQDYYRLRAFFEPYHVRVDMVPGQTDLSRDGVPRAFDGLPDEPTWLYIRGDERNPDKSHPITPDVPAILNFEPLSIQPVTLPADAWQPELRPWVIDSYVAAARQTLDKATTVRQQAADSLAVAGKALESYSAPAPPPRGNTLVAEQFQTLDTARWQLIGGDWHHQPGVLSQRQDGKIRSALRWKGPVPQDFEATVRFTIRGGSQYRSVGIAFDTVLPQNTPDAAEGTSEQNVYVSAQDAGPKIHAAHLQAGQWQYPGGAAVRQLPIRLNQTYLLQLKVRGSLLNAFLDNAPVLAFETPLARHTGALQLTVFDAIVDVHEFQLHELHPEIAMIPATTDPARLAPPTLAQLQAAVRAAESALQLATADIVVAEAALESVRARAAAVRSPADQQLSAAAVRAERQLAVATARRQLAAAEQQQQAADSKPEAAQQALTAAQQNLEKATAAAAAEVRPEDSFTKFSGAAWTPTRFFNSGKDDPEVRFQSVSTGRRSALARWITDRRNPLTARVAVNHLWTRHMGQPLVPTMFDFGRKGTPPEHPELLDWLACELMDSGWSMRHVHSLIVTSSAWRLSSSQADADAAIARDPENRLYWRRNPIRLESQVIRDSLLALAGTLDLTMGGPPVPISEQTASSRRSLYFFHSNNERNLFLTMFDEALVKDCYRREQSIVPQQALALSNSELAFSTAEKVAAGLANDETRFITEAFRLLTAIEPGPEELEASRRALREWQSLPAGTPENARASFIRVLINHNDFVTLR
ncbi:MAG: DUF1553 domain-containing protein [Planctomyces sp.]|jgi:hypothetical protein|nr:DUF1553 domain-containing protein [Planctomyces sp.]